MLPLKRRGRFKRPLFISSGFRKEHVHSDNFRGSGRHSHNTDCNRACRFQTHPVQQEPDNDILNGCSFS